MAYLIDGNNLLGHLYSGVGIKDPGNRAEIVGRLAAFQRISRTRIVLVFDGRPPDEGSPIAVNPKFTILFPDPGDSADILIAERIARQTDKRRFFVVSSDREIRNFARSRGLLDMSSEEFSRELRRVLRKAKKSDEMKKEVRLPSPLEVRLWDEAFRSRK